MRKPYKGDCPFGPNAIQHCTAARFLGVRPKDLTQMPLRRAFHLGRYVYDPLEIFALWKAKASTTAVQDATQSIIITP